MRLLNAHIMDLPPGHERFDTLVSPSGTVATLNALAEQHKVEHMGFDSAFPNPRKVEEAIRNEVEEALNAGKRPVVLCTTLVYNAEVTLGFADGLRRDFGNRARIVLGGQLVPHATEAFIKRPSVDAVCAGDAEALFPRLIADIGSDSLQPYYSGWLRDGPQKGRFAFASYDHFFALEDRMAQQREVSGFSQLCIQGLGGPGCSWAAGNAHGACDFCALQNITEMNARTLTEQMEAEARLQHRFQPDRFFDVANQFLPFLDPRKNAVWLRQYIEARNSHGVTVPKYAYLTVGSINNEIASLLKEAGVVEVYLGVDHFDTNALREENKSHRTQARLKKTLDALKAHGISVRMGLVVGSAKESTDSLRALEEGVQWLRSNYATMIKALGVFPIYVLPGSKVYDRVKGYPEARSIVDRFEAHGFFTKEDETSLTEIYIRNHSEASPEEVMAATALLQEVASSFAISYDYNQSPNAEVLKN